MSSEMYAGRADDALQRVGVAALLLRGRPRRLHDPLDDVRVGELDDDAVAHAARDGQRLRPVAGDVHRDLGAALGPLERQLLLVPLDRPAVHQVLHHPQAPLELGDPDRLQADDAPRRVAAADAHHHPAAGEVLHGRVPAGRDRRVADPRVGDAVAELDPFGLVRDEREQRVGLLPEDVRVVRPAVLEAVPLGELDQLEHPRERRIGHDGHAELHGSELTPARRPARAASSRERASPSAHAAANAGSES